MVLMKLAYFGFSAALFMLASYPFRNEMRNRQSFFSNLRKLQKENKRGSLLLALAFFNLLMATSFFLFSSNTKS